MPEAGPKSEDNRRRTLGTVMRFARLEPYQQQHFKTPLEEFKPLVAQIVETYRLMQIGQVIPFLIRTKRFLEETMDNSAVNNQPALQAAIDAHVFIFVAIKNWREWGKEAKVGINREPRRMCLEELLALLVEEPNRMEWLADAVTARVRGAMAITPKWVMLNKFGGHIDIDQTVSRVTKLEQGGREWVEPAPPALRRPVVTLDEALGLKPRTILPI